MTFVLVGAAMALRDLLGAAYTVAVARGRGVIGGIFDALSDVAAVLSLGVAGVECVHRGMSLYSVELLTVMGAGSLIGTVVGTKLGRKVAD